jgi:hypothetical protein
MEVHFSDCQPLFELGAALGLGISIFVAPYARVCAGYLERIDQSRIMAEMLDDDDLKLKVEDLKGRFEKARSSGKVLEISTIAASLFTAFVNLGFLCASIIAGDYLCSAWVAFVVTSLNIVAYSAISIAAWTLAKEIFRPVEEMLQSLLTI